MEFEKGGFETKDFTLSEYDIKILEDFANEIIEMTNKYSINGKIQICNNVFKNNVMLLLNKKEQ